MNERIKELMNQSMVEYQFDMRFSPEKFAELIVRECAEFARQHNLRHADRSHMIHKAIKQHFGVEE